MRHVIMQANEGPQMPALMERLRAFGVTRVVFPSREYRSESYRRRPGDRNSLYETARLMPHGEDGGFADRFLRRLNWSRHTSDT